MPRSWKGCQKPLLPLKDMGKPAFAGKFHHVASKGTIGNGKCSRTVPCPEKEKKQPSGTEMLLKVATPWAVLTGSQKDRTQGLGVSRMSPVEIQTDRKPAMGTSVLPRRQLKLTPARQKQHPTRNRTTKRPMWAGHFAGDPAKWWLSWSFLSKTGCLQKRQTHV